MFEILLREYFFSLIFVLLTGGASSSSSGGQAKSSSPRKNTQGSDKLGAGGGEGSSSETEAPQTGSKPEMTEYTCCHCLLQTAATESRPIGLVTLIQSSSVLAHKHESTNHLVLPTTEEEEKEELPPSWSDSLGLQYDQLFQVRKPVFTKNRKKSLPYISTK